MRSYNLRELEECYDSNGIFALLAGAALVAGCTQATPEQQVVNDAATALGGRDRILAVKTLVIDGEGTQYNLGQDVTPEASGQTFTVTAYRRAIDVAGGRARTDLTRRPNFTFFQGPAPQRQVNGVDGAVGYNVAPRMAPPRGSPITWRTIAAPASFTPRSRPYARRWTRWRNWRTLRAEGAETLVDVTPPGGVTFTLAIDTMTKLPTRVLSKTDDTNLGDVVLETRFAEYQDAGGIQLPMRMTTRTDDFTTAEIRVS